MEFREMVRKNRAISREECIELLKTEVRGVLAVLGDGGYPYCVPLNHWYNEQDGRLYFHGGKAGHRIDAVKNCDKVSFCVYDSGFRKEGDWALNIKSVIVFGRMKPIEDPDRIIEISRQLSYKFTSDDEYINEEIRRFAKGTLCFELIPEHISGKLVNEK